MPSQNTFTNFKTLLKSGFDEERAEVSLNLIAHESRGILSAVVEFDFQPRNTLLQ